MGLFTKAVLWIAFFLTFASASAQQTEGHIRYLITHNWAKKMAAVDYISQQRKDESAYMWGKEEWKLFSDLYFNQEMSKYIDSEEKVEAEDFGYSWRKDEYTIRRDFVRDSTHDAIDHLGKVYLVEDVIQFPPWKVKNDLKEVAGHLCMNAYWVDTVKLQNVTAWFALDIPVSAGPERLGGLPGVILELDVNDGAMVITADKVELAPLGKELDLPTKKVKGKKISEAEYTELIKKHMAEKRKAEQPYFWGIRY
jgi:GLPGLI family protein